MTVDELKSVAAPYGPSAYVLTGGDDGRPRVNHCIVEVHGDLLRTRLGRTASANIAARPAVAVL